MRLYASGGYCQISSAGTLSATLFSGSGASLTALNATNITAGVVAEARIHSSIARLAAPALTGDATAKTQALNNNSTPDSHHGVRTRPAGYLDPSDGRDRRLGHVV